MTQIEKEPELLPCPMCGGNAKHGKFNVTPDAIKAVHELYYHFACTSCGLATAECEYTTIEQAAAAWNTRAPTTRERDLEDQIKTLKQKLHNRKLEVKSLAAANAYNKQSVQKMQTYLSNLREDVRREEERSSLLRREVRELKLEIEKTRDAAGIK